jgi:hypothetical protein
VNLCIVMRFSKFGKFGGGYKVHASVAECYLLCKLGVLCLGEGF